MTGFMKSVRVFGKRECHFGKMWRCPMNVDVTDNSRKRENGTECILCMECVRNCPKDGPIRTGKKLSIELKPIVRDDVETVWKMQVEAFSDLLEKYQDYDMSPAAEDMDKVLARFEQPWTTYFFIMANNEKVGVVRVVDKKDGSRKRISPIWIMPEYRNKGYAQQAILAAEKKYGSNHWCLDTILQEKGNLHLYEKLGYHQTGRIDRVNNRMDIVYYEKD